MMPNMSANDPKRTLGVRDHLSWGSAKSHRHRPPAASAPMNCATMKPGTSGGDIPAKVSLSERAIVTAGLANEVDDVNQ